MESQQKQKNESTKAIESSFNIPDDLSKRLYGNSTFVLIYQQIYCHIYKPFMHLHCWCLHSLIPYSKRCSNFMLDVSAEFNNTRSELPLLLLCYVPDLLKNFLRGCIFGRAILKWNIIVCSCVPHITKYPPFYWWWHTFGYSGDVGFRFLRL